MFWNLNVHFHIHNIPPLVPTLSLTNPFHALLSYSLMISVLVIANFNVQVTIENREIGIVAASSVCISDILIQFF